MQARCPALQNHAGIQRKADVLEALNGKMRHLADELHDLIEVVLLLQDFAHDLADVDKIGVKLVVEGLQ